MSENKTPFTFYMSLEQRERLQALSELTGIPIAEMLRRGADMYIRQAELKEPHVVWRADIKEQR